MLMVDDMGGGGSSLKNYWLCWHGEGSLNSWNIFPENWDIPYIFEKMFIFSIYLCTYQLYKTNKNSRYVQNDAIYQVMWALEQFC